MLMGVGAVVTASNNILTSVAPLGPAAKVYVTFAVTSPGYPCQRGQAVTPTSL